MSNVVFPVTKTVQLMYDKINPKKLTAEEAQKMLRKQGSQVNGIGLFIEDFEIG